MRWLRVLPLLLLSAAPQQPGPDDGVVIDEIKKEQLDRLKRCEESKDWKGYWAHLAALTARHGHQFLASGPDRWTGVRQHFLERSAGLPSAALERWRFEYEPAAVDAFAKAREKGSRSALEAAASEFFFSSGADEVLDGLAREALDEGRNAEAASLWERLLRWYPDPDVPLPVLAARAAHAWASAPSRAGLESVRAIVASRKIRGEVLVAGREEDLSAFLARLAPAEPPVLPPLPRVPSVPGVGEPAPRVPSLSNEIRRWTYDFAADRGEAPPAPPPPQIFPRGGRRFFGGQTLGGAPPLAEFPLFPAYGRSGGRDFVVFTDGYRVVAVDPHRVQAAAPSAGVYFKHPPAGPVAPPGQVQAGLNRPYVGLTIDGDRVLATMVSPPSLRPRDAAIQAGDNFEAVTAVKCLQLPSGRVLWDTDSPALQEEFRRMMAKSNSGLGFWDRNFSFCGAPLVDGGRVYLGVCTSPLAEQESAVLCLDRASGRPLWATSLASFVPARGGGFPAGRAAIYQTLLALEGGLVVAQTNLGVVAGLDPATGRTAWLTRYRRARMRENGQGEPTFLRPANWPVAWQGDVYVLPQDRPELLAFEAATGRPKTLPPLRVTDQDVDVRSLTHLLGVANGMLVITGSLSHVVQLSDFRAYTLSVSDAQRAGRGAIVGDRVYLPVSSTAAPSKTDAPGASRGALGIYDQRTWKSVGMPSWRGENEYGNLLAAGRTLVVATNRISIYTDAASLRREYESRIAQHPPRTDALLEYGDLMRENERLEEAADAYLAFIRVAEGDARHDARARQVKNDLHAIYLQRGDESADPKRALEYYGLAKGFAFDDAARAEASRKLAETLEKSGRWAEAVAQYQELIERGRGLYHREADGVRKLAHYARERVDKIVAQAPEAYEEVERRAAAALEEARRQGGDALRDVMDRFPNSKTAVDAWRALRDRLRGEGSFERLRGLFRDFEDRFRRGLDFEDMRGLLEVLEKTSDADRLRVELDRFAAAYGDREMGTPEKPEPALAWAARRKAELPDAGKAAVRGIPPGPLRPIAELEARVQAPDAVHAATGPSPLQPLGRAPAGLPPGADLFARGSSVELWDVREKRRLWACARPGGWLGLTLEESEEGVVSVESVAAGSPAEKSGVEEADELLAIDGRGAGPEELADRLRELGAGRSTELVLRRAGKEVRIRMETAALPAELRPGVVAAAWTCDGSLAVAWEDGVASIDPADGRVRWVSDDVRRGFTVRGFHAVDGRLLVYEAPLPGSGQQPVRPGLPAELIAHRLIALSDVTGELAWAHPFPAEAAPGAGESSVHFLGRYFGEHVSLLQSVPRSNAPEWYLWTFKASTGEKPEKRMLPPILAWAVDENAGVLYYLAEPVNERRGGERKLESRSIDPSKTGFKQLDLVLRAGEHVPAAGPTLTSFSLAAEGEYVVLMAASASEHRIRVFKNGALFRSLSLREGRTLASGKPEGALLENGVLHVLNVPRDGGTVAYLTAFRIDAPEPSGLVAWEAVAPLPPGPAAPWTLVSGGPSCLALVVPGATLDGATATGAAFVYDRSAGGRLRLARAADGAAFTQGRLYVLGRDRTEVFGE